MELVIANDSSAPWCYIIEKHNIPEFKMTQIKKSNSGYIQRQ